MDLVRQISSTAKSIREEHHLRNRLPLKVMTVAGQKADTLSSFIEVLKDEVNVKEVVLQTDISAVANTFLYLKTPLIGKRLGRFMKDIMTAGKGTDWSLNTDGTLAIAGQTLNADEFELRLVLKEGLTGQALPDNTAVVQLDTEIVPALEREGIARDFVRMIQSRRKEQNFDISDRITLAYHTDSSLIQEAITEHKDYIMEQVLATALSDVVPDGADTQELGDSTITFEVVK